MKSFDQHNKDIKIILSDFNKIKLSSSKKKIRFERNSTNSTRRKESDNYNFVKIGALNDIVKIDVSKKEIYVEPNVPMDKLLNETLRNGLMPAVVPEFPGITIGGAINGAALESSSFKHGQFNDSCLEYEIIRGDGKIINSSASKNKDLFHGMAGSYGSLGLLTLIKMKLIKAEKYVKIKILKFQNIDESIEFIKKLNNKNLDFVEGIIFSQNQISVIIGKFEKKADNNIKKFSGRFDDWFYRFVNKCQNNDEYFIPIKDYLFRYDRGAFWMGEYPSKIMHIPGGNTALYRALFDRMLKTRELYRGLHLSNYIQRFFIQDIYFPISKSADYVKFVQKELDIYPIWLCPIKSTSKKQKLSPNFLKEKLLLNVGVWGQSNKFLKDYLKSNRDIEKFTINKNGRKMLYAQQYYSLNEFWKIYDRKWYEAIRKKYHAKIFPDIYEKTFVSKKYKPTPISGFLKFHFPFLEK